MTGQSETKHTPGELRVSDDLYDTIEVETNAGHDEIARTCFINRHDSAKANLAEERANAARIVLTWNCHDELVAALREMVRWHGTRDRNSDELLPPEQQEPEVAKAMAVLAKATSPTP